MYRRVQAPLREVGIRGGDRNTISCLQRVAAALVAPVCGKYIAESNRSGPDPSVSMLARLLETDCS